ncbi:uncharacterized protein LOC143898236 isoform X2 [Temnothorax americanus]|uniref:uncharacterized protein LOC143898236 isoform X2 n=1 Tax=Temnothorax americanus TaxID=1964332 RepID=UPI004068D313
MVAMDTCIRKTRLASDGPRIWSSQLYRLCHLHFEEKWYKIGQKRASLHLDAVPTIFFGRDNTLVITASEEHTQERNDKEDEAVIEVVEQQEETNSISIQTSNATLAMDRNAKIAKPSTSSSMCSAAVKETSRQKKWREQRLKLKAENKMLRERLRRLRKKVENLEKSKTKSQEESKEHEILRQLGSRLARSSSLRRRRGANGKARTGVRPRERKRPVEI